jgi:hypothetical protein
MSTAAQRSTPRLSDDNPSRVPGDETGSRFNAATVMSGRSGAAGYHRPDEREANRFVHRVSLKLPFDRCDNGYTQLICME